MNLTKKLATLFLTLSLIVGTSIVAFAAPNDDVISSLRNAKVPQTYIIQAENYLKTTTLTQAQSTAVIEKISQATDIVTASGVKDLTMLSEADKNAILADIVAAGNSIGLTVNVTKESNGQFLVVAKNISGNSVLNFSSNEVKQTGLNNTLVFAGILMIILAASSVFILRRNTSKATV
jgi:hypothetical protein